MSERTGVWRAAGELARDATVGALATVARHRGSLPMASDAKMLVTADGRRWGTVGGGCVEAEVTRQALEAAAAAAPAFVRHTLDADAAGDIGLSCGGTAEFFLEPLVPEMAPLYAAVAAGIAARARAVVVTGTDWSGGPRKTAVVGSEVVAVGERYPEPAAGGEPVSVDEARGAVVERIRRVPRVVVCGAGHVGAEIARVAAGAGFHVVITDDRAEFANRERIPWAHEVVVEDFRTVLDRFALDEDDFVLAATRGHSYDAYVVERAAATPAGYVGMLGSKRKRAVILRALEAAGVPRDKLDRVRSPIGLEIGADTPAEIAVAVVAELIKVRRGVGVGSSE
jgi:xanthine dehydrogenase accessory factor